MDDKVKKLYDNLSSDGYKLGTVDEFAQSLADPIKSQKFYANMSADGYKLGSTFDEFNNTLGLKKKDTSESPTLPSDGTGGTSSSEVPIVDLDKVEKDPAQTPIDLGINQTDIGDPVDFLNKNAVTPDSKPIPKENLDILGRPVNIGLGTPITNDKAGMDVLHPSVIGKSVEPPQKPVTVGEYLKSNNTTPEQVGLSKDYNLDKNITPYEQNAFNVQIGIKKKAQADVDNATEAKGYFAGAIKNINIGTEKAFRDLNGAERLIGDAISLTGIPKSEGVFGKVADYIHKNAVEGVPDVPDNVAGEVVKQGSQLEGLFLEMLAPIKPGLTKLPIIIGGSNALNTYGELSKDDTPLFQRASETAKSFDIGFGQGAAFTMMGVAGGKLSEVIAGKTGSKLLGYLGSLAINSGGFAGYTAGEALAEGKPIDKGQVISSALLGGVLSVPELANVIFGNAVNRVVNTSDQTIKNIDNSKVEPEKVLNKIQELDKQIESAKEGENTDELKTAKTVLENTLVTNAGVQMIKENPKPVLDAIEKSDMTTTEKKIATDKVQSVVANTDPQHIAAQTPNDEIKKDESEIEKLNTALKTFTDNPIFSDAEKSAKTQLAQDRIKPIQDRIDENKKKVEEIYNRPKPEPKAEEPVKPEETPQYLSDEPKPPKNIKDRMGDEYGKKPTPEQATAIDNTKELYKTLPDGTKVYFVDIKPIRDADYGDFVEGGNDNAYPNFVPKGEIWIDNIFKEDPKRADEVMVHEAIERKEMQDDPNWQYYKETAKTRTNEQGEEGAHVDANKVEQQVRDGEVTPDDAIKQYYGEKPTVKESLTTEKPVEVVPEEKPLTKTTTKEEVSSSEQTKPAEVVPEQVQKEPQAAHIVPEKVQESVSKEQKNVPESVKEPKVKVSYFKQKGKDMVRVSSDQSNDVMVVPGSKKVGDKFYTDLFNSRKPQTEIGMKEITDIVKKSESVDDAREQIKQFKNINPEVAKEFKDKYDPENKLTPEQAFEKFYNEAKTEQADAEIEEKRQASKENFEKTGLTAPMREGSKGKTLKSEEENQAITLNKEGETNATNKVSEQEGGVGEHQRVPQGENLPSDQTQVREGESGQAGDSGSGKPKEEVPVASPEDMTTSLKRAVADKEKAKREGVEGVDTMVESLQSTDIKEKWEAAKESVTNGEVDPKNVTDRIIKDKTGSAEDEAVLLYDRAKMRNRELDLMNKMRNAKGKEKDGFADEIMKLYEDMGKNDLASAIIGREASNIFRLRQEYVDSEYAMFSMENEYAAVRGVEDLNPEQLKYVHEQYRKLREAESKVRDLEGKLSEETQKRKDQEVVNAILEESQKGRKYKPEYKNVEDRFKAVAKVIRSGKIADDIMLSSVVPFTKEAWNLAVEATALTVEGTGKLAQAILDGLEKLRDTKDYKGLDKDHQDKVEKLFTEKMKDRFSSGENEVTAKRSGKAKEPKGVEFTEGKIKIPTSLLKELVRDEGIDDIDKLVQRVRELTGEDLKDATDREIRDAITNYGKTINMSKDQVDVQLRKMRRIGKLLSAIEDANKGERPKKSGLQRDKPTIKEREMRKELNELLKDLPVSDADLEKYQKTALDGIKTRLKNRIEELNKAIETKEKIKTDKKGVILDEEAKSLNEQRDKLQEQYDNIFPKVKKELSFEEKVAQTIKSLDRAIDETNRKIKENDLEIKEKTAGASTKEIEAKRGVLQQQKDVLKKMRDEAGVTEKENIKRQLDAVKRRAEKLQERYDKGDFAPKKKPVIELPKKGELTPEQEATKNSKAELYDAQLAYKKLQMKWKMEQQKELLSSRPGYEKVLDKSIKIWTGIGLLSGIKTLGKLANYTAMEVFWNEPWDVLETWITKAVLPGYAKRSLTEGHIDWASRKEFYNTLLSRGKSVYTGKARNTYSEAFKYLKERDADLDVMYKDMTKKLPDEFALNFGKLHGAEKYPLRLADFEKNYVRITNWYDREGFDVTDPSVKKLIGAAAYEKANFRIMMSKNFLSGFLKNAQGFMMRSKSPMGKIGYYVSRVLFPIISVPTNYTIRTARAFAGMFEFAIRTSLGFKEMDANELDMALTCFKQNLPGLALGAMVMSTNVVEVDDQDDLYIGGMKIPKWMTHHPQIFIMKLYAEAKKGFQKKNLGETIADVPIKIMKETPYMADRVTDLIGNPKKLQNFGENLIISFTQPQLLKDVASMIDPIDKRRPMNFGQRWQLGIPGKMKVGGKEFGRETVPANVDAIKKQAQWDIEHGKAEEALSKLNTYVKEGQMSNREVKDYLNKLKDEYRAEIQKKLSWKDKAVLKTWKSLDDNARDIFYKRSSPEQQKLLNDSGDSTRWETKKEIWQDYISGADTSLTKQDVKDNAETFNSLLKRIKEREAERDSTKKSDKAQADSILKKRTYKK
jgi:hypothetical protein